MPDAKLREVGLLVVLIIDVVFDVEEIDKVEVVAWHSPARRATHTVAHSNDSVDKDGVENGVEVDEEVSYPRNFSLRRRASSSGMQRTPAAVARKNMHSVGVVPSHSQAENSEENDGHDDVVASPKSVALSQIVIAWCHGTSRLYRRCKKRGGQSA